jgi:hypothetical protein
MATMDPTAVLHASAFLCCVCGRRALAATSGERCKQTFDKIWDDIEQMNLGPDTDFPISNDTA